MENTEYLLNNVINETRVSNQNLKNAYDLTKIEIDIKANPKLEDIKKLLTKAMTNQKDLSRSYENNKKKYKLMQRYAEVLTKVSNLIDIIPTNFDDLSLKQLNKNMYELNFSRRRNYNIMKFDHFQNLFSEITTNLMSIETSFQNGTISAEDAAARVANLRKEMDTAEMPSSLESTKEELDYLITTYEREFQSLSNASVGEDFINTINPANSPDRNDSFNLKRRFRDLNTRTSELAAHVTNLHNDISEFEPSVDLDQLFNMLQTTDTELSQDNWNYDAVSSKIMDLNSTTDNLTLQQQTKNTQHQDLAERVKEVTKESENVRVECSSEIVITMHRNANIRSQNSLEVIETMQDENLLSSNFSSIAQQYTAVISKQTDADNEVCLQTSTAVKNTTSITTDTRYDDELNAEVAEKVEEINEQLLLQQQSELRYEVDTDDEDAIPPVV